MKKFILAVAVAAVAIMAVAASVASAGGPPARYQVQGLTITAVQPKDTIGQFSDVWTHTYNVTFDSACGASTGSFSGTGSMVGTGFGKYSDETVTGNLNTDGTVSLTATRPDGVQYSLTNAKLDGSTVALATSNPAVGWALEFHVSATSTSSDFKNHGDYVSSQGGGNDAAHSCIGMPIH